MIVNEGDTVVLNCTTLVPNAEQYSWRKGTDIVGNMSTLTIFGVDTTSEAVYQCIAVPVRFGEGGILVRVASRRLIIKGLPTLYYIIYW